MDQLQRVYAVKELPRARAKAYAKETVCHQAVASCPGVLTLYHVVEEPEATYLITVSSLTTIYIYIYLHVCQSPIPADALSRTITQLAIYARR